MQYKFKPLKRMCEILCFKIFELILFAGAWQTIIIIIIMCEGPSLSAGGTAIQIRTESIVPHPLDLQFIVGSEPLASSAHCKDTSTS